MDQPVRILVVDDEPHLLDAMLRLLEQVGYEVWAAATSSQAWQLATEKLPDLILLDVALPGEDGFAFCRRVKAEPSLANSLVALLSDGRTASEGQAKGMEAGADEYISRPLMDRELLAHVHGMVRIKRIQDELRARTHQLRERIKELDCLYGTSALLEKPGITLDEILQAIVDLMPPAWQYPEITAARISLDDREFVSAGFQKTSWSQACDLFVKGEPLGCLQVCYLEERPERDEGPFLREERDLLEAIAGRLGRVIERLRAQAELEQSKDRLRSAHQMARIGHWDWSIDSNELRWSREVFWIFGCDPEHLRPTVESFEAAIHPDDLAAFLEERERALAERRDISIEYRIVRPDGTVRYVQELAEINRDAQGRVISVLGTVQDITERKRMEEALRKQTTQLESLRQINLRLSAELDLHDLLEAITQNAVRLLEGIAGGFYLHRPDLDLLEWVVAVGSNRLPLGTMVRRGEGLSGRVWQTDRPLIVDDYQQWAGRLGPADVHPWGGVVGIPVRYGREAGEGEFFGVLEVMAEEPRSFSPEDAELLRLFSSHAAAAIHNARLYELAQREIAEREQAQEQLRQERDLVSRIMETSPMGIVVLDRQGRIVYANPQVSRIWGRGLESLILRSYDDPGWRIVSEDAQPQPAERRLFTRVLNTGEPVVGEQLTIEAEGGRRWSISVSVIPLTDESGQVNRLVAMVEDVTARLQAEKALRESEARYRRLVETSPDAIALVDPEGNILACNQQAAALHGFESREAMVGVNVFELFPPEELPRARENTQKALMEGSVSALECVLWKKDGTRFPAELSASAVFDEEGRPQAFVSVVRDITQRVQARAALQESEERLRSTLSSLDDLVFVLDADCRYVDYYQPVTSDELYLPPQVFLGRTVRETMPPEVVGPFQEAFDAVAATHEVQQFDYPLALAGEQQWFSAKVSARFDREGAFDGVTIVSRNITERKRAAEALERRNRVLEILNKLSEVAWSTLEMDPLLNTVVQVAVQAIDATSGYICDWHEHKGTTTCLAEYYAPAACDAERFSDMGVEYHMEEDFGDPRDWLYSSEAYQIVHANDSQVSAKERVFMERFGVKSMLNVPLKIRGKLSGYIELWESRQERTFAPEEIELVLALARQLSIGMEKAQLYEQTQRELVERRQAQVQLQASLQEKEVLLKEIHHRVKNNLQVISSLLDMQSLSIQNPDAIEALEDSRHRVRTMAFVHERLYQSEDLASVDVREYLESLAGYLLAAYERDTEGIRLNLQVDDVCLDLDMAIASGLIVNELVSNALKHAFPPVQTGDGEIGVELGALEDGRFELQVRDNGVGFPSDLDPVGTQSLGLRLVSMLTQQLQGTLELIRDDGTTFRITFPGTARAPGEKAGR